MPPRPSLSRNQKPRELRRRVLLSARMRNKAGWSEVSILNLSSRGLLIHANRLSPDDLIELRHGDLAIMARVVWRDGAKAGLSAEDRLPVEWILSRSSSTELSITAPDDCRIERPKPLRAQDDSRHFARMMEFISIIAIAVCLAGTLFAFVEEALAGPVAQVELTLGG